MSVLDEFMQTIGTISQSEAQMDVERMLDIILAKARRYTAAEAGSIFVLQNTAEGDVLKACSIQNDRINVSSEMFSIPVDRRSIAGYVAVSGEVVEIDDLYEVDAALPFTFNRTFDDKDGYRSKSMLAFPLKNIDGGVVGVVQLLNHIAGTNDLGDPEYTPFPMNFVDDMRSLMTVLGSVVERAELKARIAELEAKLAQHQG